MPEWKISRNAALKTWRESLPADLRAEMDAAWKAAKANGLARREAKQARDRMLVSLSMDGLTSDEIAARLGANKTQTRRRCAALGIQGGKAGLRPLPSIWVKAETRAAIDALAAERGVPVADVVERVLTYAFEDGAPKAKAMLRRDFLRLVDRGAA